MTRPVIGVTGPDRGGTIAWWFTAWAIWRAGGRPRRIRPGSAVPVDRLDGLIVGGGADVGEPNEIDFETAARPLGFWRRWIGGLIWMLRLLFRRRRGGRDDTARDVLEFRLVAEARRDGTPMLGICRGAQLINMAFGGTLQRDLSDFYEERPNPRSVLPTKDVVIEPSSRLAGILDAATCRVNALHSHAVDAVGDGLRAVARERNGVTQGIEAVHEPWVIGVQWHPEYLPHVKRQRRLFAALIERAATVHARLEDASIRPPVKTENR